jgi:hypothetical protein
LTARTCSSTIRTKITFSKQPTASKIFITLKTGTNIQRATASGLTGYRRADVDVLPKSIIVICLLIAVVCSAAGFFARGLFDRNRIPGTAGHYQDIKSELDRADEAYIRIEGNIEDARSGVTAGVGLIGTIGVGLDGIESLAVENTGLLGRAERILLDAGARERGDQE